MKYCLLTALLMLTTACGLAVADDSPAQSVPRSDAANPVEGGGIIRLKLNSEMTRLRLYERDKYTIIVEREDASFLNSPNPLLINIEEAKVNYIVFHTLSPGLTLLNLGDDAGKHYAVEITIVGDTRPLQGLLERLYPQASIQTIKVGDAVLLRGTVAQPTHVAEILEIAEQFYPKTLNQLKAAEPEADGSAVDSQPQSNDGAPQPRTDAAKSARRGVDRRRPMHQRPQSLPGPLQPPDAGFSESDVKDIHQSVRQLRGEVRALRHDVRRLLKALEEKDQAANDPPPSDVSPAERRIQNELEQKVSLAVDGVSLKDLAQNLSRTHGFNIALDERGLREEGVTGQIPVTLNVSGIKLESALRRILEPLNLSFQVRNDVLLITSTQRAQGGIVVVTYPVADLIGPIPRNIIERDPTINRDTLVNLIQGTIRPSSWDVYGGPASIQFYETMLSLVIRQTGQAHREIYFLLEQLREIRQLELTRVSLETRFIDRVPENFWKEAGVDRDFQKDVEGSSGSSVLTDRQTGLLLQAVQNDAQANVITCPETILLNNHLTGSINSISPVGNEQPLTHSLHIRPTVSADRRSIRLNVLLRDRESPQEDKKIHQGTVPQGHSLLIDLSRYDAAARRPLILPDVPNLSRFKDTGPASPAARRFLLIRPRIVIDEEKQELLGTPQQ